jgi:hypothetical protein
MYGQVHVNYVLYQDRPEAGHKFRQISVHELDSFIVLQGEGNVIQAAEAFLADNPDAHAGLHNKLDSALREAKEMFDDSVAEGWTPYNG